VPTGNPRKLLGEVEGDDALGAFGVGVAEAGLELLQDDPCKSRKARNGDNNHTGEFSVIGPPLECADLSAL